MYDPVYLHIITISLLVTEGLYLRYLWKKHGFASDWIPLSPIRFLGVSLLIMVMTAVGTLFLGSSHVLLATEIAIGIVLSVANPVVAVTFLVANLFLRPWELAPPNAVLTMLPKLLAALAVFSWIFHSGRHKSFRLLWNSSCTWYVALLVWLAVSALFSGTAARSLDYLFQHFFPVTVVVLLVANVVEDRHDVALLRATLVTAVCGTIAAAIFYTLWGAGQPSGPYEVMRLNGLGLWGNANDLAALVVLALPFVVVPLFDRATAGVVRLTYIGSSLLLLAGLGLSQSRGAILALAAAGVLYLIGTKQSVARRMVIFAAIAVVVPVIMFVAMNRASGEMSMSSSARWGNWVAGALMAKSHPIFGVGIGNYPKLFNYYTPVFIEWGERTAHSSWVLVLAEAGPIGLLLFSAVYLGALLKAWKRRAADSSYMLSMASYGVAMTFLSHTYLLTPYLIVALTVAFEGLLRYEARKVTPAVPLPPVRRHSPKSAGSYSGDAVP